MYSMLYGPSLWNRKTSDFVFAGVVSSANHATDCLIGGVGTRLISMKGFVVVVLLVLLGDVFAWWISARWLRRHRAGPLAVWACHLFFALQMAYVLGMIGSAAMGSHTVRRGFSWMPRIVQAVLFVWHLFALPISILMWSAVHLLIWIRRRIPGGREGTPSIPASPPQEMAGMSRRDFMLASIAAVPPLLAVGASGYGVIQSTHFRVNRITIAIAGLPPLLHGFTLAHVSDLHVGLWSTDAFLDNVVRSTNALDADVILFTGDLIDISTTQLPRAIAVMRRLRARHGLYLTEGNHDLIENPAVFHQAMLESGLKFLRDQTATITHNGQAVQLLGAPWTRGNAGASSLQTLMQQRDANAFPILMAHHPHLFDVAEQCGLPLTLSGHTHGGQFALTREVNVGKMMYRYVSGLYQKGASTLFVSNGTGNWFPLRINAPAEIVQITLTAI